MNPAPETIGRYTVHPVASLFPLLEGDAYQDLKKSIEQHGQQKPIVVQNGVLIDGRNRLAILLELGKEPVIQEYAGTLAIEEYILVENLWRRHLTDDQRVMIAAEILRIKEATEAQNRKRRQRRVPPKSGEQNSDRHAGETASKIAAAAKTTRYQAEQAISVVDHAPDMVEPVKQGKVRLKDAARTADERKAVKRPQRPAKRSEPNYLDAKTKGIAKLNDAVQVLNKVYKAYPAKQEDLDAAVDKVLKFSPPPVGGATLVFGRRPLN